MTEKQWLEFTNPTQMLACLDDNATERKLRLFASRCCRQVWHLLKDARSRAAVEVAEGYCDGSVHLNERHRAGHAAQNAFIAIEESFRRAFFAARGKMRKHIKEALPCVPAAELAALTSADNVNILQTTEVSSDCGGPENEIKAFDMCRNAFDNLLRSNYLIVHDLFGDPFRPVTIEPRWLTSTVVDLANAIYDDRAFDRMPILADALMDAGCDNDEIIAHCRGNGPHVRGCWVVDLLLGKE